MRENKLPNFLVFIIFITLTLLPSLFVLDAFFNLHGLSWIIFIAFAGSICYMRLKYHPYIKGNMVRKFFLTNKYSLHRKLSLVILSVGILIISIGSSTILILFTSNKTKDNAIKKAKEIYLQKKFEWNNDFGEGYCLTNEIQPNWAADIVHNPRQNIDNLDKNQCAYFLSGTAKHLVELDFEGNLINAR